MNVLILIPLVELGDILKELIELELEEVTPFTCACILEKNNFERSIKFEYYLIDMACAACNDLQMIDSPQFFEGILEKNKINFNNIIKVFKNNTDKIIEGGNYG